MLYTVIYTEAYADHKHLFILQHNLNSWIINSIQACERKITTPNNILISKNGKLSLRLCSVKTHFPQNYSSIGCGFLCNEEVQQAAPAFLFFSELRALEKRGLLRSEGTCITKVRKELQW